MLNNVEFLFFFPEPILRQLIPRSHRNKKNVVFSSIVYASSILNTHTHTDQIHIVMILFDSWWVSKDFTFSLKGESA